MQSLADPHDTNDCEVTGSKVKISQRWPYDTSLVNATASEPQEEFEPEFT